MARIIYGVHGTGHGHAIRALAVARHYSPRHEFLFVSHADGKKILESEFRTIEIPNPVTPVKAHRVDFPTLAKQNLAFFAKQHTYRKKVLGIFDQFKPDFVISDYEYFTPEICRQMGIHCISFDNTHIITLCGHELSLRCKMDYFLTAFAIKTFFSRASQYLISCFFNTEVKDGIADVKVLPPLQREIIFNYKPEIKDHIVAYQGYETFKNFLPFLKKIKRKVFVYGCGCAGTDGNIELKNHSEKGFLEDLSSCSYVVCGGGHTLISEALYFGKPVISFPITGAFEQYINAFYLEKLGYGKKIEVSHLHDNLLVEFEKKLDDFRGNIRKIDFNGNPRIFEYLDKYMCQSY